MIMGRKGSLIHIFIKIIILISASHLLDISFILIQGASTLVESSINPNFRGQQAEFVLVSHKENQQLLNHQHPKQKSHEVSVDS